MQHDYIGSCPDLDLNMHVPSCLEKKNNDGVNFMSLCSIKVRCQNDSVFRWFFFTSFTFSFILFSLNVSHFRWPRVTSILTWIKVKCLFYKACRFSNLLLNTVDCLSPQCVVFNISEGGGKWPPFRPSLSEPTRIRVHKFIELSWASPQGGTGGTPSPAGMRAGGIIPSSN